VKAVELRSYSFSLPFSALQTDRQTDRQTSVSVSVSVSRHPCHTNESCQETKQDDRDTRLPSHGVFQNGRCPKTSPRASPTIAHVVVFMCRLRRPLVPPDIYIHRYTHTYRHKIYENILDFISRFGQRCEKSGFEIGQTAV